MTEKVKIARRIKSRLQDLVREDGFKLDGDLALKRVGDLTITVSIGQSWNGDFDCDPCVYLGDAVDTQTRKGIRSRLVQATKWFASRDPAKALEGLRLQSELSHEERIELVTEYYRSFVSPWIRKFSTVEAIRLILEHGGVDEETRVMATDAMLVSLGLKKTASDNDR